MSTAKTKIDAAIVLAFLKEEFDPHVTHLEPITGGEVSQGFFFTSQNNQYVIRINKSDAGFQKDAYAYKHFASPYIPIPKTIEIGKLNEEFFFSITKRAPGRVLETCTKTEIQKLTSSILTTLDAIHAVPIMGNGYGDWDFTGNAGHHSWREHLLQLVKDNEADLQARNHADFLEPPVIQRLTDRCISLIDYCPEVRKLIHADFEDSNTLTDGTRITGVIDWENSKYGDPLFDHPSFVDTNARAFLLIHRTCRITKE